MMGSDFSDHGLENSRDASASLDSDNPQSAGPPAQTQSSWSKPLPEHLSEPTYWPAVMALGITALLWGIVTSIIFSLVGLALFVLALIGWIGELLNESPEQ